MSEKSKPRGHAHLQSVADAAALFGSGVDDPFASILGGGGLGGVEEQVEDLPEPAPTTAPASAPADEQEFSVETPKLPSSKLPAEKYPEILHFPAAGPSGGTGEGQIASSPSTLFSASEDTSGIFSGNTEEDWLHQNDDTAESSNAIEDWYGSKNEAHDSNVYGKEVMGAETGAGYNQYNKGGDYYNNHSQHVNGSDTLGHDYYDSAYNQGSDTYETQFDQYSAMPNQYDPPSQQQQPAYDQGLQPPQAYDQYTQPAQAYHDPSFQFQQSYDPSAMQYDPYSEQQVQQQYQNQYDPSLKGYDAAQARYNKGLYQENTQAYAEQFNQYTPSSNQYHVQQQEQQGLDPLLGDQYDEYGHQQVAYDPSSTQYNLYNQQEETYDAKALDHSQQEHAEGAVYNVNHKGDGQEVHQDLAAYPGYEGTEQKSEYDAEGNAGYTGAESELEPYNAIDPSLEESGPQTVQHLEDYSALDDAGHEEHQPINDVATTSSYTEQNHKLEKFDGDDYKAHNSAFEEEVLSPSSLPAAREVQGVYDVDPYAPSGHEKYGIDPYTTSIHNNYEDNAYTHEVQPEDDNVYQQESYSQWASTEKETPLPERQVDSYFPSHVLQGNDQYQQPVSDYFDNVGSVPVVQDAEGGKVSRSMDVTSPYDPRLTGTGYSSLGEGAYMSQDRAMDVAEERHRAKIPLASFSIDGKLLTFFPIWSQDSSEDAYGGGGYGMGRSAAPTKVTIRPLRSVIPPTSYASSKNPLDFPGPALEGETSQGSALSRATGASASTNKAKKASLIRYLYDAAAEISSGIGYLTAGNQASEARRLQDRILILKLLVLFLEHDGSVVNNSTFDNAVKNLLLEEEEVANFDDSSLSGSEKEPWSGPSVDQKARFLSQMESLLMAGQRKEAVDLAVQEKMWTHAVVIASGMDRTTWREVVGQFVTDEFDQGGPSHQGLKVAYHLFSGQEPKTTYDLFRPKTSLSSTSSQGEDGGSLTIVQWRKSVATILANRNSGDSATLTAIGDGLKMAGWIEASHFCYLLSPLTSPMEGYDNSSARLTLLGANSPEASTLYLRDLDHIMLSEVFEYALSLQPMVKGTETYHGLAFLQPYRLIHAYLLAEMGEVKRAIRYCDSIMTLLKHGKMNRYYHPLLVQQLQELSNRLQGDTKSTSWTKKKPTMDGVWSALEGRFTKFIAGEDDGGKVATGPKGAAAASNAIVGPFSHYSAITPDARSGGVSRVHSTGDFKASNQLALAPSHYPPQSRPGSAIGFGLQPVPPMSATNKSTSEYSYSDWTPPARDSISALSSPKPSLERDSSDADLYNGPYTTHATSGAPWYGQEDGEGDQQIQQGQGTYYGYQPHGATQSQFVSNVEDQDLSNAMNGASLDERQHPQMRNVYEPTAGDEEDDEDDLGFGNKSTRSRQVKAENDQEEKPKEVETAVDKAKNASKAGDLKPATSWFGIGKFWGKSASSESGETKAKKAHLGEETSFYYDTVAKRWVNKKVSERCCS